MSAQGIRLFAEAMSSLQSTRHKIMELGAQVPSSPEGKQDILLAQLLDAAKDAVKDDFIKITSSSPPRKL